MLIVWEDYSNIARDLHVDSYPEFDRRAEDERVLQDGLALVRL